jgi:hypothetical protein
MKIKNIISLILVVITILCCFMMTSCDIQKSTNKNGSVQDKINQTEAANELQANQPTPTDIEYSLERYNLIRRAYWVNGQRQKAMNLPCEVQRPLGYIILISGNSDIGRFEVDGKVSSLNSYLTPDSEYYEYNGANGSYRNNWIADVDGTYGTNDNGIFFFTPDGKYIEWTGTYLYSDIPFIVDDPIVNITPVE